MDDPSACTSQVFAQHTYENNEYIHVDKWFLPVLPPGYNHWLPTVLFSSSCRCVHIEAGNSWLKIRAYTVSKKQNILGFHHSFAFLSPLWVKFQCTDSLLRNQMTKDTAHLSCNSWGERQCIDETNLRQYWIRFGLPGNRLCKWTKHSQTGNRHWPAWLMKNRVSISFITIQVGNPMAIDLILFMDGLVRADPWGLQK